MQQGARGSVTLILIILLGGIVFATANILILMTTVQGTLEVPPLRELYRLYPLCVMYFVVAPLLVAILVAVMVRQLIANRQPEALTAAETAAPTSAAPALRLLGLLQQEGRFIDFVEEDIDGYNDAQVGAAVRSIHAGCRKALRERVELQRVLAAEDGSEVTIDPGFDPAAVRLIGNVTGNPPFRGTLQHGGWRATKVSLPQSPSGTTSEIITPAEVEIP